MEVECLADLFSCMLTSCLVQAHHAERLVSRGVGVISYEAPAYRKGRAGHPSHYTAEGITGLIRQVCFF